MRTNEKKKQNQKAILLVRVLLHGRHHWLKHDPTVGELVENKYHNSSLENLPISPKHEFEHYCNWKRCTSVEMSSIMRKIYLMKTCWQINDKLKH